jgi:WD and tetratricopeptide repeat-containing protein 1
LPEKTDALKTRANNSFEKGDYHEAVNDYNKAVRLTNNSAILYSNLAATLMKRHWYLQDKEKNSNKINCSIRFIYRNGDMYEAMRCCYQALYFDKDHLKSHFRLARCLHELNWHNEASECLHMFCERYPDYATSSTCESLVSDIEKTLIKLKKADETRKHKANQRATKRNGIQTEADSGARASSECFDKENFLQTNYVDYAKRFVGHCNVATDIKEATFIGTQYVGAGSDDGSFYIWGRCSIFSYYQRSSFFYSSIHLCIPIKYRQTHNESRKNIES